MPCKLSRPFAGSMTALALALALGAAPMTALASPGSAPLSKSQLQAQRPALLARAQSELLGLRHQLGLGEETGFIAQLPFTNPQGRTVARFTQIFQGHRVWAGEAIVHLEAEGAVQTFTKGVKPGIALATAGPSLGPEEAKAIALRNLAPKGALAREPKVEAIVFPTKFNGGLATRFDPEKKTTVWDREMSVFPRATAEPYVWAYEVSTVTMNVQDGVKAMCYIIDGTTGAILRKWNDVQGDTPSQGTGQSYLRGTVPLSTARAADGTYSLNATDCGSLPHPMLAQQGITQVGLTTYHGAVDYTSMTIGFMPYSGHAGDTWGDGTILPFPFDMDAFQTLLDFSPDGNSAWLRGARAPQGETSAVDAHHGLTVSWNFYKNVFNRDGIDNKGTSPLAVVHHIVPSWYGPFPFNDNAFWLQGVFGMFFGTGSRNALYPGGGDYLVELDITGHELTHGVCRAAVGDGQGLIYAGLSGGLNEANSDILGKSIQAYADGGALGSAIPGFQPGNLESWELAKHWSSTGVPLRYMYKPSLDGASADGLFDGLESDDVHFSSGPLNRMFYFLCEGASGDASALTHSPYLPAGMAGIGMDKAARIWYKTLTEHLNPDSEYLQAREGAIRSAQELYGAGSGEEAAVMKAFSAINVGLAPGQAPRPYVTLPMVNPAGSFFDTNAVPNGILRKVQVFPTRTTVRIQATVLNSPNQKLVFPEPPKWSARPVGIINPDGTWLTPHFNYYWELLKFQVNAEADPNQFARGSVLLAELDGDQDTEIDAIDLGATAMSWGKTPFWSPQPSARIAGGGDDWDLEFFNQAFTNGFRVQ